MNQTHGSRFLFHIAPCAFSPRTCSVGKVGSRCRWCGVSCPGARSLGHEAKEGEYQASLAYGLGKRILGDASLFLGGDVAVEPCEVLG